MDRRSHDKRDTERKSHKRKAGDVDPPHAEADGTKNSKKQVTDAAMDGRTPDGSRTTSRSDIRAHIDTLKRCVLPSKSDRAAAKRAARAIGEFAMQGEDIELIIEEGAVGPLVKQLHTFEVMDGPIYYDFEVEKESALAIAILACKPEHQRLFVEAGALKPLVALLQRKVGDADPHVFNGAMRRAADAICNLARGNKSIQARLRSEGVVTSLERLLDSSDRKVQRAASDALHYLAAKNEESKAELYQRNGSRSAHKDAGEQLQTTLSQGPKDSEPSEVAPKSGNLESKVGNEPLVPALNLNTPEALSKAKLALEKQKQLAEKLKKLPQVGQAKAQSMAQSLSSPVSANNVSQASHGIQSGGKLPTTTSSLGNVPAAMPGMPPLNMEALKKVQEVAARFGLAQPSEPFPFLPMIQGQSAPEHRDVKRPVLRLDAQGREIDEHGNVVERTKISNLSTLKVNINKHKKESFQILQPAFEEDQVNNGFFDPEMGMDKKKLVRPKRPTFQFVAEGTLAKQAEIQRMKSRFGEAQAKELKMKQAALAKAKAEADINPNLIEVSERFPVKDKPKDPVPDVEWWDAYLLPSGKYPDSFDGEMNVKMEKLTIYVEHPVPIEPPAEPAPPPPQPLKLTKKERKKLRTQRRLAKEKDKQDMIRQGLLEPPKPKVKMSNLMKVLGAEATQDPTKMEMEIRSAAAEREQAHMDRNLARKLTPAERRKKKERKLFDDPNTLETWVAVFRVNDLSHGQTRFKVDVNAQENKLTGCIVMCDTMSVVVVEGGSKSIKRYTKLMLHRIKWAEAVKEADETAPDGGPQPVNRCTMVWQGSVAKPNFDKFTVQQFRTEVAARKFLADSKVGHYWDLAANYIEE